MGRIWKGYLRLWRELTGIKMFLFYALHFTAIFAVLQYFVFLRITGSGMSFVWSTDGTDQHFARLLYISDNAHALFSSLFSGEGIKWPLYDFRTGFTVHDLQVGLPHLLAALWPSDKMDSFYPILVIGNYYLAGLTFSAMGFFFKQKPFPVLIGAVAYSFCGYAVYAGVRHPHFMVPIILLPVLIMGTERALRGERSILLSVAVILSLTAQWGLYFSCMQVVFVVLYTITRLICMPKDVKFKVRGLRLLNVMLWGILGVLIACAVAIPSLISMTGDGRADPELAKTLELWKYSSYYFKTYLLNFSVNHSAHSGWLIVSLSVLAVPALAMLFTDRDREVRHLQIIWVVLTVMHSIPLFAFILSGFSNIANRFCFGYAFFNVMILMFELSKIREITKKRFIIMSVIVAAYIAACFIVQPSVEILPYAFIVGTYIVAAVLFIVFHKKDLLRTGSVMMVLLIMTAVAAPFTAKYIYTDYYLTQFYKGGKETIEEDYLYSASQSTTIKNDSDFFRIDGNAVPYKGSASGFHYGLNTLTGYPYFGWSNGYDEWVQEMEMARYHNKHRFLGINARPQLLTLSSIKYFMDRRTDYSVVPYGFDDVEEIPRGPVTDVVTENENPLPIGYTYDSYMLRSDYEKLWALDKQEAIMENVVIDEAPSSVKLASSSSITPAATRVPCSISGLVGITCENGKYTINNPNAMMILEFEGLPETNTYLRFNNMVFDYVKSNYMLVSVSSNYTTAVCTFTDCGYIYYTGQDSMLLDLGYNEPALTRAAITFDHVGSFTMDDIEIWCESMEAYPEQVSSLKGAVLENLEFGNRSLKGTISTDEDKFLLVTIPYMNGWTAYLDGEEVRLYQANTAFMGIEIPAGDHSVEFRYWLPGLTPGLILSFTGILGMTAAIIIWNRKNRKCNTVKSGGSIDNEQK
ncbi:Uncharacterized membrane protein YfhO [Ruminococcaceae bacterium YRB3002]|nr:Uncharacterized membrane protein YfhO [Ruminococcaceae bacterium YRB3002]